MMTEEEMAGYLARAYGWAQSSPDPRTKNSAMLVAGGKYTININRPWPHYSGDGHTSGEFDEHKTVWYEHAERAVIYLAARLGRATNGAVMVSPWAACVECARAIIHAGIAELITHAAPPHPTWDAQIAQADEMLHRAGVIKTVFGGPVDADPIMRGGVLFDPRAANIKEHG